MVPPFFLPSLAHDYHSIFTFSMVSRILCSYYALCLPLFFEQFCDLPIIFLNLRYLCNFCYYAPMNFQIGHIEIFFKKNMATLIHFELVSNIFYNHLHVIQGDDCKNAKKSCLRTHLRWWREILSLKRKWASQSHSYYY